MSNIETITDYHFPREPWNDSLIRRIIFSPTRRYEAFCGETLTEFHSSVMGPFLSEIGENVFTKKCTEARRVLYHVSCSIFHHPSMISKKEKETLLFARHRDLIDAIIDYRDLCDKVVAYHFIHSKTA